MSAPDLSPRIFVSNDTDGTVTVMDGATLAAGAGIATGANATLCGLNFTTNLLVVANRGAGSYALCRHALIGAALAAVLGQVAEQRVHGLVAGRVDHRASLATHGDEAGVTQAVEMEGQGVGRELEGAGDPSRRHAVRPGLNQQAEHIEAIVLGKGGQGD